jgi:hypothetical protein
MKSTSHNGVNRASVVAAWIQGKTYRDIGKEFGISGQRVQQIVRPPLAVYNAVKENAKDRCQDCGAFVRRGHVHHLGKREDFNDLKNLVYLCPSCHSHAHNNLYKVIHFRNGRELKNAERIAKSEGLTLEVFIRRLLRQLYINRKCSLRDSVKLISSGKPNGSAVV